MSNIYNSYEVTGLDENGKAYNLFVAQCRNYGGNWYCVEGSGIANCTMQNIGHGFKFRSGETGDFDCFEVTTPIDTLERFVELCEE